MNKKYAIITTLAGALLLAGCSAPSIDHEAIYLDLVHENTTNTASDSKLITTAHAACKAMESGATIREIAMVVATSDLDSSQRQDVSKIIGYGISQYCPEYSNQR